MFEGRDELAVIQEDIKRVLAKPERTMGNAHRSEEMCSLPCLYSTAVLLNRRARLESFTDPSTRRRWESIRM